MIDYKTKRKLVKDKRRKLKLITIYLALDLGTYLNIMYYNFDRQVEKYLIPKQICLRKQHSARSALLYKKF